VSVIDLGVERFLRRIENRAPLSDRARSAFVGLPSRRESYQTYRDIVREGEATRGCCLLAEGFVSRYKTLPTGGRQINSFHYAGEMVDLQSALLLVSDHGIRTHVATTVLVYASTDILELAVDYPEWGRAVVRYAGRFRNFPRMDAQRRAPPGGIADRAPVTGACMALAKSGA
jgi:CRP-like cAMP-binding protein